VVDGIADPTACSVVCGGKHTLILTESGTVQAWGWNWRGQCGTGDFKDILTPTIIKAFTLMKALQKTQIVKISAGDEHSIALSSDGRLYSYGSNADGQVPI
jgi:alpha-tubulin suppressor-like RCC1 family protein